MNLLKLTLVALLAAIAAPAAAQMNIGVVEPFAIANPAGRTGAVFLTLDNSGAEDDRLVAVQADVAERVELHTMIADQGGVMRMRPIEGGIAIPAGESHALQRGGDHIMLLGLTRELAVGVTFPVTLVFERLGMVTIEVTVVDPDIGQGMPGHGMPGHGMPGDAMTGGN